MAFPFSGLRHFSLLNWNCEVEISRYFTMRPQRRLACERKRISVCIRRLQEVQTLRRSNSDAICKKKTQETEDFKTLLALPRIRGCFVKSQNTRLRDQ